MREVRARLGTISSTGWAASIAGVTLLVLLLASAGNVQAVALQTYYWTNSAANGNWSDGGNWGTTNGAPGDFPGNLADSPTLNPSVYFTNAATYNVVVDVFTYDLTNLFFSNFAGTSATITLDLDNNGLAFAAPVNTGNSVVIGDGANSTTTVYIAATPGNQLDGLAVGLGQIVVGRNGNGTLVLTNGIVSTGNATVLGNGSGGQGTIIISGPNSYWSEKLVTLGGSSNSYGNTLIVSNNASMTFSSTPSIGSSSGEGGSSNNVFIIDHSYVNAASGPTTLGNRAGTLTLSAWGGTAALNYTNGYANASVAINNRLIIKNGGVWDNGSGGSAHSFCIGDANPAVSGIPTSAGGGGPASNNVLSIMANSYFTNASNCGLTPGNVLDLQGGTFGAILTNNGIVQGWGTMLRNFYNSNGVFAVSNAVGALNFHQNVTLGTNSAITVQLGANPGATFAMGVTSNLTIRPGRLNISAPGVFTTGTYTVITWDSSNPSNKFIYQGWTIGTTPSPAFNYTVSTNTLGHVDLVVAKLVTPPVVNFNTSPTSGPEPWNVTFTDTSTGIGLTLYWNLGDGTLVTNAGGAVFSHTYAAGTYTVTLMASNSGGAISTLVSNNLITALSAFQAWQFQYFGCTNCAQAAADADPDGDGVSNINEFLAGTDPTSSASALRIISIARRGIDVAVTWSSEGGHQYVLQSTKSAAIAGYTTNFADVSPVIVVPGNGEFITNYLDTGVAYAPVLTLPGGSIGSTSGTPSLVSISAANTRGIADSLGQALPVGSLLMLGTFSISEPTIQSNFSVGNLSAIMLAFSPYGAPFAVGDGTALPASWDVSRSAAGFGGQKIYLVAINKSNVAEADHLGIFTAPSWIVPADGSEIDIALEDVTDFVVGAPGGPLTIDLALGGQTYVFDDTARLSFLPGRSLFYRVRLVP